MSTLTKFSKSFIKTCVAYKIADKNVERDYDIVKAHEGGTSLGRLAIKHGISKQAVLKIVNKYKA